VLRMFYNNFLSENSFRCTFRSQGEMWTVGDLYIFSVDVSEFASEVIHLILGLFICVFTQYLMDAVCQKCQFPADVGPMSVTSSLEKGGLLSIKAQKHTAKSIQ
uniref:Uncharacterized protein n=2 Tax=Cyprinus carpio TaxID=7962 RepID=A0A9J7ZB51_CYPCA